MKRTITLLLLSATVNAYSQPKVLTQAIISTKTTIVSPEEEDSPAPAVPDGNGDVRIMRFGGGDGETKSTTWLKNDLVKTYAETEMGRTTIIRDNGKKITTTIMEMMGKKFGFYATDEDQEAMRKRMDSMMRSRNQDQSQSPAPPKIDIIYFEETKKIAGYDCNKAMIITTRSSGRKDSSLVWYTPLLSLQGISSTGGGFGGFGGFSPQMSSTGMELIKGFPMQYERNMGRGRKMTVEVTKIVTDKEVPDKEFEIPKDIEIKSAKEMQNGAGPGMFQMRRD